MDGFKGMCRTGPAELLAAGEHARKRRVETEDALTQQGAQIRADP
jgi:hypothetical protein